MPRTRHRGDHAAGCGDLLMRALRAGSLLLRLCEVANRVVRRRQLWVVALGDLDAGALVDRHDDVEEVRRVDVELLEEVASGSIAAASISGAASVRTLITIARSSCSVVVGSPVSVVVGPSGSAGGFPAPVAGAMVSGERGGHGRSHAEHPVGPPTAARGRPRSRRPWAGRSRRGPGRHRARRGL